ncbi:type I-F CRISPR-associated protein Csy1 [Marinospirillum insulare]|uniref:Type I-F CRISPR-associated protein Csy1 n=1 Tax=Marinospirillum insulare TaxID=217169 RepID=A0ABQ5ZYQ0_9GAMM|nr:type I-F CRISPR-associated protein Csy1 [Marinospirillum insulare]GLR63781.1 type I-F CRISPR-associated protein Csy1 [Marinospirillum insulare]
MSEEKLSSRAKAIRKAMHDFIADRLSARIEKLAIDDPKYQALQDSHLPDVWLASAIDRSPQIQVVTHPLKATYPHAHITKTTSLYCQPKDLPQHNLVATQALKENFTDDVTGNAGALDIYALLQIVFEGKTLLKLCLAEDKDMQAALHDDPETGKTWLAALADVTQPKMQGVASHNFAKQLFWFAGDDPYNNQDYLLLAPLYSSTLAHKVYEQIDFDRFTPESKEIRDAVRANKQHDGIARSYPQLAVQVIGGANPQGISSLSSKRRGVNYLLASLPPSWKPTKNRPPFKVPSIFTVFEKRRDTAAWVNELKEFLASSPPSNVQTRKKVDWLVNGLLDELTIYAAVYQELPAGWSVDEQCHLPLAQRCWLDPARALHDADFAAAWLNSEWAEQVEQDFARWLNQQLGKKVSQLGDIEFRRWAKEMQTNSHWESFITDDLKQLQKTAARSDS